MIELGEPNLWIGIHRLWTTIHRKFRSVSEVHSKARLPCAGCMKARYTTESPGAHRTPGDRSVRRKYVGHIRGGRFRCRFSANFTVAIESSTVRASCWAAASSTSTSAIS